MDLYCWYWQCNIWIIIMAHYAFLDNNNIVTEVITGKEGESIDWEQYYGNFRKQVCKQTSYNTRGNIHLLGGTPFRKNYAGIGYRYDENLDAFIPPQPYDSWVLNTNTCLWEPPISMPIGTDKSYEWNESTKNWVEV